MSVNPPDTPSVLDTPVEVVAAPGPTPGAPTGPLDLLAITLTVILCLSWGLNQVAVKLALPDVPPVIQATIRAAGAALLLTIWMLVRGVKFDFLGSLLSPQLRAIERFGGDIGGQEANAVQADFVGCVNDVGPINKVVALNDTPGRDRKRGIKGFDRPHPFTQLLVSVGDTANGIVHCLRAIQ